MPGSVFVASTNRSAYFPAIPRLQMTHGNKKFLSSCAVYLSVSFLLLLVAAWIWSHTMAIYPAYGISMEPTVSEGDVMIAPKGHSAPDRGEIVIVKEPGMKTYFKRVAFLSGERVQVPGCVSNRSAICKWHGRLVPPGHYFLLGDNSYLSLDSRQRGPVSGDYVIAVDPLVIRLPW